MTEDTAFTTEKPAFDEELIVALSRCIFQASDTPEDQGWHDVKHYYRKLARRTLRRLDAAGYKIEKIG